MFSKLCVMFDQFSQPTKPSSFNEFSVLGCSRRPASGSLAAMKGNDATVLPFVFETGKEKIWLVKGKDMKPQLVSLKEAAQSEKATSIFKHCSFAEGNLPARIEAPAQKLRFAANEDHLANALESCLKSKGLDVRWVMKLKGKELSPVGFLVSNKKQMILKPGINDLDSA